MISEKLFERAFAFKKMKLWEKLWDGELFAVQLSGGRIGYISIMGRTHQHYCLALYVGQEALESFFRIAELDPLFMDTPEGMETMLAQECLQCAFEGKDMLTDAEKEAAKGYAREHGIRISGSNAYPQFLRYLPAHFPWPDLSVQEQEDLCEALDAACFLAEVLKTKDAQAVGLWNVNGKKLKKDKKELVILVREEAGFALQKTPLPGRIKPVWTKGGKVDPVTARRLKKLKGRAACECQIIYTPRAVQDKEGDQPYYPVMLMCADAETGRLMPVDIAGHYEKDPSVLLRNLSEALVRSGSMPSQFLAADERTFNFMEEFCTQVGIPLQKAAEDESLDMLNAAKYDFHRHMMETEGLMDEEDWDDFPDSLDGILDGEDGTDRMPSPDELRYLEQMILNLPDEDLQQIPEEFQEFIRYCSDMGVLSGELQERLRKLNTGTSGTKSKAKGKTVGKSSGKASEKGSGEGSGKKTRKKPSSIPEISYVISVSLGVACYRHMQISARATLADLHQAILREFRFDDDHLYAFFIDDRAWSDRDAFYKQPEPGERSAARFTLYEAGLTKGKKFLYLFDYGDEWRFECKVLRVLEEDTPVPRILKSKGKAPAQYSYDEW